MKVLLAWLFLITISASATPIDEIRIDAEGLPSDQIQTLRSICEFFPGDEFDDKKNDQTLGKIKDYMIGKGFVDVKVKDELSQDDSKKKVLHYRLDPGIPLKLSAVELIPIAGKIDNELSQKIISKINLKPGENFDRERLKDMKRSIEVILLGQDYIDSKVVDVKTEFLGDRAYKVIFRIDLGQQVSFSVSGNDYFSRNELMTLINEQREIGLGRDYVSVLSNRIKESYLEYGFRSVSITPYHFEASGNEPRKVVFQISEGARIRIRKVIFDGQESFSQDDLEDLFFESASDRLKARIYNEKMIDSAGNGLIGALKSRGYLSAKLIAVKTEELKEKEVNLKIFISEGIQTITQSIDFTGNSVIPTPELKNLISIEEDRPMNLSKLEEGLEKIKKAYRDLGYLDVAISNENSGELVTYSERNQFAILNVAIDEGKQTFFGGVRIYGLEKTQPIVIEREIQLKVDEPISERKLLESEDRLRRLGIFNQISIELLPSTKGTDYKELKVSVTESIPGNLGVGAGFRNDLGFRLFGEVTYANLWGLNHSWVFNVSGNRRVVDYRFTEFKVQTGYVWPWFTLGETTLRPNVTAERRQYRAFDAETYGLSASLDRMLLNSKKLQGTLTYTIEQIRQFNAVDSSQNQQIRIGSITPGLRLDLRDSPLTPRRGFFSTASFEYASSILGSQEDPVPVSYGRFQSRTDFYMNFIPRVVWFTSLRGGWLKNFANTLSEGSEFSIPLIKQFALGGVNSMRGYIEQEINVQASDKERRVRNFMTFVNYRTQLDFFASQNLSLGPFLDAGNLNVDSFTLGALQYGTGVGLRYMTPVGPVNFDWGFKLFSKNFAESNVFYFSLGVN